MLERRNEFIAEATAKLEKANKKILSLDARKGKLEGDARDRLEASLSAAQKLRDATNQRVQEMRLDGPDVWEDVKPEIEQACRSVSDTVEKAAESLH